MQSHLSQTADSKSEKATAFISYAREDRDFVGGLIKDLATRGVECKGDWLLTTGEDYARRLREFNLVTHAFIFVISPDSITSDACRDELLLAVENKKQILPVSRRDHGDDNLLDSALRAPHWTLLREGDDFERGLADLVKAINTDFALMDMHGRLLVAAENWDRNARNRSYLWRKEGLKNAEGWLAMTSTQPDKLPQPTPLEVEFITAGQRARTRGTRIGFGISLTIMIALLLLSGFAFAQRRTAVANAEEANRQATIAKENEEEAVRQKKSAIDSASEAKRQQGEAEKQKKQAEDNLAEAERQRTKAEEQTKIATEQRREAEDRGRRLQKSYSETDYRAGNQLVGNHDYGDGVAYLAHALDTNPGNAAASDRLFTLLTTKDPPRLVRRIKTGSKVTAFDVSSDGDTIASVSDQGEALLWKGEEAAVKLKLHGLKAQTLRFFPERESLFVITTAGPVLIFDLTNLQSITRELSSPISLYAVDERFDKMAAVCEDGTFALVPLTGEGKVEPVTRLQEDVCSLSFINYDRGVAVLSKSGFRTWKDLSESKTMTTGEDFDREFQEVNIGATATDGTYVYSQIQNEGLLPYIDVVITSPNEKTPPTSQSNEKWPTAQYDLASAVHLDFNVAAKFLAVTLDTEATHILRRSGEDLTLRHEGLTRSGVHPNQELLFTASRNGTVNLWNTLNGKLVSAPLRHSQPVVDATFSQSGEYLVALTEDGTLNVWDIDQRDFTAEDEELAETEANSSENFIEKRDRKGRFVLTAPKTEGTEGTREAVWQLLKASNRELVRTYKHPLTLEASDWNEELKQQFPTIFPSSKAAISEDGNTVVTIIGNNRPRVWHTDSDRCVHELGEDDPRAYARKIYLTSSGDKSLVEYQAAGDRARSFYRIFSLVSGKALSGKIMLRPDQTLLDVSRDLERIIIGEGSSAYARGAYDFHLIGQEVKHQDRIGKAAFFHDGRAFCTVSYDASARIWDTETGLPLSEPLEFGRYGGVDQTWKVKHAGKPKAEDYNYALPSPIFVDDGRRVAIGVEGGRATKQVWDISIGTNDNDATRLLVELATQIYGQRLNQKGAVETFPQPSMSQLRERFAKDKRPDHEIGRLIEWLLTDRKSRKATPYSKR